MWLLAERDHTVPAGKETRGVRMEAAAPSHRNTNCCPPLTRSSIAVSSEFHRLTLGSSAVCHVVFGLPTPITTSEFTSVARVIALPKSEGVIVVPAPVKLPHCESVSMLVESQVFGPQLGIGVT